METKFQTLYQDFLKKQMQLDYDWEKLSDEEKSIENDTYTRLKIAASKELLRNTYEAEQQDAINNQIRLDNIKNSLIAKGFACDNSIEDWYKLFNKPEIFGANWQSQADYEFSISSGLEYFLNKASQIII